MILYQGVALLSARRLTDQCKLQKIISKIFLVQLTTCLGDPVWEPTDDVDSDHSKHQLCHLRNYFSKLVPGIFAFSSVCCYILCLFIFLCVTNCRYQPVGIIGTCNPPTRCQETKKKTGQDRTRTIWVTIVRIEMKIIK